MAYCTPDDVKAVLRLGAADVDDDRIDRAVDVAAESIDHFLDRPVDEPLVAPYPASVVQANINLAVEEYRRPGAAFGILNFSDLEGATRVGADHLVGIRTLIQPYKRQWGIA